MPTDEFRPVLDILSSRRNVLVTTHVKPDADALGTAAAMVMGLRNKGLASRVLLFNPLPHKHAFLFEENHIPYFHIEAGWPVDVDLHSFDALLCVDTGTWSQLPGLKDHLATFKAPKIVMDHHLTQENWADVKLVVKDAAAAGEIAAELLEAWGVPLDAAMASVIFIAIASDTGWFQYSSTSPKTMRLAARLMEAGAQTQRIYQLTYQNDAASRLLLMTRALQSLELLSQNRLAVMSVTKADFDQIGAEGTDTENLINIPLQVEQVEASLFLSQRPGDGPVRVSLRSKGGLDVAAFAQRFGGGGHARAAGLKIDGDIAVARRDLTAALVAEIQRRT